MGSMLRNLKSKNLHSNFLEEKTTYNHRMPAKQKPKRTPAWLYWFFDLLRRSPIPLWLLGLLIIIIGGVAMHLDAWSKGLVPNGQFNRYLTTVSLFNVGYIAVWMWLDARARVALAAFFRNQRKSQTEVEAVWADFVSIPTLTGTLIFLAGMSLGYLSLPQSMALQPLIGKVLPIWDLFSWIPITGLVFMLLYRTLRQAFLIPRFFRAIDVDIFNPAPVYALSRFTSQAAVILFVVNYALLLSSLPDVLFTPLGFVYQILIVGSSLIYFFAPLTSVNQRMREAKGNLLAELGGDVKRVVQRVHQGVDKLQFGKVNEMRTTIGALKDELEIVQKIPTWPWQPETLRNVLTPLLLPILIYLVQRYLGSMFGF